MNSHSFTSDSYVLPVSDPCVDNMKKLSFPDSTTIGTVTRNPSFLGYKYAIYDTFFRNFSVVFDIEKARFVGRIRLSHQSNIFSNVFSMPHPIYCLLATTNQDLINFISPT